MGILGFTWGDAGAFVGGALGGAFLGPPGAMLGSAVGSYAGAAWGDGQSTGAAMEEAIVSGIGAAGGAWATNLAGKLVKDGIGSAATKLLSNGAARRVDTAAGKVLLPWNKHDGGPVAALGGALGGYEVSPQARLPVTIATTDIGNGGCPVQVSNLVMPSGLSAPVGSMYRRLPGYLCDVWQSFGSGSHAAPPAPAVPESVSGSEQSGIPDYAKKARLLNTMMDGFAALDRKVAVLAKDSAELAVQGQAAVDTLIDTVNQRAGEAQAAGSSADVHALDLLNDAFKEGRQILSQAVTSSNQVARQATNLIDEIASLRKDFESHLRRHRDDTDRQTASGSPAPQQPRLDEITVLPQPSHAQKTAPGATPMPAADQPRSRATGNPSTQLGEPSSTHPSRPVAPPRAEPIRTPCPTTPWSSQLVSKTPNRPVLPAQPAEPVVSEFAMLTAGMPHDATSRAPHPLQWTGPPHAADRQGATTSSMNMTPTAPTSSARTPWSDQLVNAVRPDGGRHSIALIGRGRRSTTENREYATDQLPEPGAVAETISTAAPGFG